MKNEPLRFGNGSLFLLKKQLFQDLFFLFET